MASKVSNAIGTQRQFAAQPQGTYQANLQSPRFGSGIRQSTNLDAELLAKSLGVLGDNIQAEAQAEEKRKREQFTDEEAQRLITGKTPEDLAKLDRVVALQQSDKGYDLTDNPYAMAALERSIGKVAAASASSTYNSNNTLPATVQEAVKSFEDISQESYNNFKDSVQNKYAFDQGFKEVMSENTYKVAETARKQIAENARSKGLRIVGVNLNNLIASSGTLDPETFSNSFSQTIREAQLYSKDPEDVVKIIQDSLGNLSATESNTDKLEALKDVKFFGDSTIGSEVDLTKAYRQIAKNATKKLADELIKKATRADGTVDLGAIGRYEPEATSGLPQVNLKISTADSPNLDGLKPELKGALGSIGGILYGAGLSDVAEITSGYRDGEHNAEVGGADNSFHTEGNAVDIYVGDLSSEDQDNLTSKFNPYFGEVLYHDSGSGLHLHLGDYKGGLEATKSVDTTASVYDPDRKETIQKIAEAKAADLKAIKRQQQEDKMNDLYKTIYTSSSEEALVAINNADIPYKDKVSLKKSIEARITKQKKEATKANMSPEYKMWSRYEKSSTTNGLTSDLALLQEWQDKVADPKAYITKEEQTKYDKVAARVNKYWAYTNDTENTQEDTQSEPEEAEATQEPTEISESGILELANNAVTNGRSQEEILKAVRNIADANGINAETIINQINWQRSESD